MVCCKYPQQPHLLIEWNIAGYMIYIYIYMYIYMAQCLVAPLPPPEMVIAFYMYISCIYIHIYIYTHVFSILLRIYIYIYIYTFTCTHHVPRFWHVCMVNFWGTSALCQVYVGSSSFSSLAVDVLTLPMDMTTSTGEQTAIVPRSQAYRSHGTGDITGVLCGKPRRYSGICDLVD